MVHFWRLYGTLGCHLCEQALAIVDQLKAQFPIELERVDIASSQSLVERLGHRIPVLENIASAQTLDWPFDPQILTDWLHESSQTSAD
ncbi:MAG TPA: glutaredoxin family protein [Marinagarivorans sp.]